MSIDKTLHYKLNMLTLFQQNPRNEMDKQEEEEQMWLDDEMDGMYVKLLLFKFKNLFMLSVRISSYGCTREVWRARKMRKSCTRR